jgi:hypothetical protein
MWNALRYFWLISRGYRLHPWNSPYIQWRFETYLGKDAANLDAQKFFRLSWQHRTQLRSFANWAADRRRAQRHSRN